MAEAFGMMVIPAAIRAMLDAETTQRAAAIGKCGLAFFAFRDYAGESAQTRAMV